LSILSIIQVLDDRFNFEAADLIEAEIPIRCAWRSLDKSGTS
jgi:hypothetical protein